MSDAGDTLNNIRRDIADDRCKARWLMVAGHVLKWVGLAIFFTGLIKGFALAPPEIFDRPLAGLPCRFAKGVAADILKKGITVAFRAVVEQEINTADVNRLVSQPFRTVLAHLENAGLEPDFEIRIGTETALAA
jgi:hypothetical protein